MRVLTALGLFMASVFGLVTYEIVLLILAAVGAFAGLAALGWLIILAPKVDRLTKAQSERIDHLPPPTGV